MSPDIMPHSSYSSGDSTSDLASLGHWPAWVAKHIAAGKYSDAVQLCQEHLAQEPHVVSGRILYGVALFHAGQIDRAQEQFYAVLASDPEHLVALKYLGDIAYSRGDEIGARSQYERILEIDPCCRGVKSELLPAAVERTHTITLVRAEEIPESEEIPLRTIPFYTETMGDLYMSQGYHRLAATVYRTIHNRSRHPRLLEKLAHAEEKIKAHE